MAGCVDSIMRGNGGGSAPVGDVGVVVAMVMVLIMSDAWWKQVMLAMWDWPCRWWLLHDGHREGVSNLVVAMEVVLVMPQWLWIKWHGLTVVMKVVVRWWVWMWYQRCGIRPCRGYQWCSGGCGGGGDEMVVVVAVRAVVTMIWQRLYRWQEWWQ